MVKLILEARLVYCEAKAANEALENSKQIKNQINQKEKVDTFLPIGKLTATSVNPKVSAKPPHQLSDMRLYQGALRILFFLFLQPAFVITINPIHDCCHVFVRVIV